MLVIPEESAGTRYTPQRELVCSAGIGRHWKNTKDLRESWEQHVAGLGWDGPLKAHQYNNTFGLGTQLYLVQEAEDVTMLTTSGHSLVYLD
jgi:hypothetical protein